MRENCQDHFPDFLVKKILRMGVGTGKSQTSAGNVAAGREMLNGAARGGECIFVGESREMIRLRSAQIAPNKDAAHPFDIAHGTDTGGYLSPKEIITGHAHDALGYGYSAIAPSVFREACRRWRDTLADPERSPGAYSFVDIGAGKGRALLLASELPFRKVIGVELSPDLVRIAQENVERWSRVAAPRCGIRVLQQDALRFRWPRTSLLVFLYNPFACELVELLLERLEVAARRGHSSKGRDRAARPFVSRGLQVPFGVAQGRQPAPASTIDLLYANPTCADVVSKRGKWVLLWTDRIDMDAADEAADPYGTTFDRVSCYRLRG
jgi:SAM-dependent methyltransferase